VKWVRKSPRSRLCRSRYVRELIRADQKRKIEDRINTLLLEGLDSGQPIPFTAEYWEEKKRRLTER
jgi:antitoxin ParD1/3/4